MADVRAFRAIAYAPRGDVTPLTAPPYDVVPEEQRADLLAGEPHNVVALELPEGPADPDVQGNRYGTAAVRWRDWLATGVLAEDESPAIYVLEQAFELEGRQVRRHAFIAAVGLEPFSAGIVLPHERTLPKALADRMELIRATEANFSQILGLYHDPEGLTGVMMDDAMTAPPMLTAADEEGVVSRVWAIRDPEAISRVAEALADQPIFIADGHHRYTVALAHHDECRARSGGGVRRHEGPDSPAHAFVMMALVNMDDPELVVLPTHRVADAETGFDADAFLTALSRHFELARGLDERASREALDAAPRPAFLARLRGEPGGVLAVAREGWADSIAVTHSDAWKSLDVAVLQELVLGPLLDIHPDRPETLSRLVFVKDPHEASRMAEEHDVALIMRPTGTEQMRAVALAGETMPQKSTYFYPKLRSGLLFRRADC